MKIYNEKKFCFIICANNKQYLEECLLYLDMLEVPTGYEVEVLIIEDAKSMAAGYNEGMNASDAKYKIYMHQDVFIVQKDIISKLIKIFTKDKNIGIVGLVGAEELSKDAVMWHKERCGNFYRLAEVDEDEGPDIIILTKGLKEVEVVDGYFMATQYDFFWREDLLDGWDFYDVSQCLEFRKRGYKVVVAGQQNPWTIHDCVQPKFWKYNYYREKILKEYTEISRDKNYFRIGFVRSKEIGLLGIPYSLKEMGHEIDVIDDNISIFSMDDSTTERMMEHLELGNYDLIMSYDFLTCVARACNIMEVKYWAWVYDSPLLDLYMPEAKLPFVYSSVFDKKQYERLEMCNIRNLFYIPLATEVSYFGRVNITKKDEKKYKTDVSFVGRLYDKRGFEELFDAEHQCFRTEAEAIANSCGCVWDGKTNIFDKASDELIQYMISKEKEETWQQFDIDKRYYCESMRIARKCNEVERVKMLNALAERFNVTLYSDESPKEQLCNVNIQPWVDYWKEMPKVFYLSKINLNITSRSIESGIPQRVFDIMSVGGFCLTNYQPEIEEYFDIGTELDVYHTLDELIEKVSFYLKHEDIRIRIAMNGYKKVRKEHNYSNRFEDVLGKIVNGECPK